MEELLPAYGRFVVIEATPLGASVNLASSVAGLEFHRYGNPLEQPGKRQVTGQTDPIALSSFF